MGVWAKIKLLIIGAGLMVLGILFIAFGLEKDSNGYPTLSTLGWLGLFIALIAFVILLIAVLLKSDRKDVPIIQPTNQSYQPQQSSSNVPEKNVEREYVIHVAEKFRLTLFYARIVDLQSRSKIHIK